MCDNVGKIDRILRAIVGVVALVASIFFVEDILVWVLGAMGVMMLFIALTAKCPLYSLLKISSCKVEN